MHTVIEFMNNNSGAIQGLSTIILVAVTTYYAYQTRKTVYAMERSEESQTRPQIAIFLKQQDDNLSLIDIVIANYGKGVARNITFEIIGDNFALTQPESDKKIKSFRVVRNGIKTLGPGQEYQAWLMSIMGRVEELQESRTNVRVEYENANGSKKYNDSYRLDFKSLPEYQLGRPVQHDINESLKRISKNTENIARKI